MDDQLLLFLVIFPLVSAGGIALICIGLSGMRKVRRMAERERSRASGTVVDIAKHTSLGRGKPLISSYPVVEFSAGGRNFRLESRAGYWADQFAVGDRVDILYDAEDPRCFHLEKLLQQQIILDKIIVAFGILWIIVAGVVSLVVCR